MNIDELTKITQKAFSDKLYKQLMEPGPFSELLPKSPPTRWQKFKWRLRSYWDRIQPYKIVRKDFECNCHDW